MIVVTGRVVDVRRAATRSGWAARVLAGLRARRSSGGDVRIKTPDGATVTINPSGMADMARRMEEAGKRMESAQKSGDSAAAGKAMGEILGARSAAAAACRFHSPT